MQSNTLGLKITAVNTLTRGGETFFVLSGFPFVSSYPPVRGNSVMVWLPCATLPSRRTMAGIALLKPNDLLRLEVVGTMDESGYLEVLETREATGPWMAGGV